MNKFLLAAFACLFFTAGVFAQKKPGPAEKKLTDTICACMSKVDFTKVTTKQQASTAFSACFAQHPALLVDVATERHITLTDDEGMNKIGNDVGESLMTQNCAAALKLGILMADDKKDDNEASETSGVFNRIDLKGFNYIVVTDNAHNEKSFLWLREFPGSDKFMNGAVQLKGKKLKVTWREMEVYLPQAKGYYKVKEITAIDLL